MRTMVAGIALVGSLAAAAAAQSVAAYKVGQDGVKAPVMATHVTPLYTKSAMDRKVQGRVQMECVVLPDGTVDPDVKIS